VSFRHWGKGGVEGWHYYREALFLYCYGAMERTEEKRSGVALNDGYVQCALTLNALSSSPRERGWRRSAADATMESWGCLRLPIVLSQRFHSVHCWIAASAHPATCPHMHIFLPLPPAFLYIYIYICISIWLIAPLVLWMNVIVQFEVVHSLERFSFPFF